MWQFIKALGTECRFYMSKSMANCECPCYNLRYRNQHKEGPKMNINEQLAKELNIKEAQVDATVKLIDEGNTIPFIARYRKEVTGSLNDEVLRNLFDRLTYLRNLEERSRAS